jgi:dynein light intermediate chain 1
MVPSGWDTWGKISVLRDGFEPASILAVVEKELREPKQGSEIEGLEAVWGRMIPEGSRIKVRLCHVWRTAAHTQPITTLGSSSQAEAEQSFLSRQYEIVQKDPNRDPRAAFRQPLPSSTTAPAPSALDDRFGGYGGVVGPLSSSGGLRLPGVEKAMMEMEGQGAEDLKEKFAKMGRKEGTKPLLSPGTPGAGDKAGAGGVPNEALHSFFQGLLASKGKAAAGTPKD